MDIDRKEFYDDFPYAVLYLSWDGLRIARCKTKEYMDHVFMELSSIYSYIKKIEIKELNTAQRGVVDG